MCWLSFAYVNDRTLYNCVSLGLISHKNLEGCQMSDETKHDYIQRVNAIIDFIDANLDTDLSLETLSEMAAFSPFHFHRIFLEITGETPNAFISRKRVEKIASILLVGTNESLNDLAYTYGFSCGNSFSRAFKKYYGVAPSECRGKFSKIGVEVLTYEKYICLINEIKNKENGI